MRGFWLVLGVMVACAQAARAEMWLDIATVSATSPMSAYRVCSGANHGTDIHCPEAAPFINPTNGRVGIGGATATTASLDVSSSVRIQQGVYPKTFMGLVSSALFVGGGGMSAGDFGRITFGNGLEGNYAGIGAKVTGSGSMLYFGTTNNYASGINNEAMIINPVGHVGIGTTSPTARLEVHGVVSATSIRLYQGADESTSLRIHTPGTLSLQQSVVSLYTRSDGGGALNTANNRGWAIAARGDAYTLAHERNDLGFIYWDGSAWHSPLWIDSLTRNVGIGTTSPTARLEVAGVVSATQFRGDGSLLTGVTAAPAGVSGSVQFNNGAGGMAGRADVVVDDNGRMGIGTATPTFPLSVPQGALVNSIIIGRSSADVAMAYAYESIGASSSHRNLRLQSPNMIFFHTGMTATEPDNNSKVKMAISSNGNVGIATTAPTARLEVAGTVSATLVKVADNGEACGPSNQGTIRFVNGRASICTTR